ncbi:tripartite tricarboxylate transporter substrate-binding protein [Variovorax sp. J22R24]|uniref:tripartite tricarboxylate transporter substrate-binding protein n=1 Tax=Variovorax gracilis TaxID=3053502 RepID=UPI002578429E|nr:tripartite tricarboxylate transporter substrate-binding protein [Variovorax sp. J22R24]MDM0109242.1 tripartite tricarboxylate transporter substrate-binding protein [Variovorax sp. J22R24]
MRLTNVLKVLTLVSGIWLAALSRAEEGGPIRLLVPFEGGSATGLALYLAERANADYGDHVYVEEKPGASGRIGAMVLKKAAPDGKTLALLPFVVPVLAPLIFKDVRYDPVRDFTPISQIAAYPLALAVSKDHPATSVAGFGAWAKDHPTQAFYGMGSTGSLAQFLGVMIAREMRIKLQPISYKGAGPMTIDLAAGHIPAGISSISDLIEMHRAQRIRVIAVSGTRRLAQLPDVPTFAEQGYPSIQAAGWIGIFAPAGTPRHVVDRWSTVFGTIVRSPQSTAKLAEMGFESTGTTSDEFAATLAADIARWAPIVKASGYHAD